MTAFLLDTCAVIWTAQGDTLDARAQTALAGAYSDGSTIWVSPISAWEIGLLAARGRIGLSLRPKAWFDAVLAQPGVGLALMSPEVLIDSSSLPGTPPNDPADRIILATARELGLTVVTRDARILDYADAGHVRALPC
ncbi:type II toxin-antitoxin system VapC family toxin [Rhodobacteraceae bacterium CCMM004]|nr:type II toxin-antitoxin system VapC family toxin [Rhodobacteraceae bacterium CCMM004]